MNKLKMMLLSLAWLLLMVFFTYTILIISAFDKDINFLNAYCTNQNSAISLLVNVGLILMLMFDCISNRIKASYNLFGLFLSATIVAICIFCWSGAYLDNSYSHYFFPINWIYLAYLLHIIFLILIFSLKYISLSNMTGDNDIQVKQDF